MVRRSVLDEAAQINKKLKKETHNNAKKFKKFFKAKK